MEEVNQERAERMSDIQQGAGTVGKITERAWKNLVFSSFTLEEGDEWYGMGTEVVNFQEGDSITFRWSLDKKGYPAVKGVVRKTSADAGTSAPAVLASSTPTTKGSGTSPAAGGRDTYWKDKEVKDDKKNERYQAIDIPRMSFSAAQERACILVAAALGADALSFGTTAKGKRLDLLTGYVDQITDKFFMQSMGAPEHYIELQREADMMQASIPGEQAEDEFDD